MPPEGTENANFRRYDPHQTLLLSPSLDEWLPSEHLARFISDLVEESIDLTPFAQGYTNEEGGPPAYHPALMLKLLLYGNCVGVTSSRRIEKATVEDVAFRYLAANQQPTFTTIARFRERNLVHLSELFDRVVDLCREAGMVRLGRVALDGTKVKANASKHKSMSHGKMVEKEAELKESFRDYLRQLKENDEEEDRKYGKGNNPLVGLPEGWKTKKERLAKIRAARKALEERESKKARAAGRAPAPIDPKAQYNFTDPDSRIMVDGANKGAFVQAYNCQAVVDDHHQVILVAEATQSPQDVRQLEPMARRLRESVGRLPKQVLVDGGYFNEAMITELERRGVRVYCPPERGKEAERERCPRGRPPKDESFGGWMRRRVRSVRGRAVYRHRKGIVEPVFGQIKQGRGLRQFLLRGLDKVRAEWKLWCLTHNLRKLYGASPT